MNYHNFIAECLKSGMVLSELPTRFEWRSMGSPKSMNAYEVSVSHSPDYSEDDLHEDHKLMGEEPVVFLVYESID